MDKRNQPKCVTISVPYRGPGNSIKEKPVSFDVYYEEDQYKAVPQLNLEERRIANLPPELIFTYKDGKAGSPRGAKEGNLHVIEDIIDQLKAQNWLP